MRTTCTPTVRETRALLRMLGRYWLTIAPLVQTELRRWQDVASAIPDPTLRAHALDKLRAERLNAEAAATFAGLVSRPHRADATRLMVAFEVMYDYLDGVSEQPVSDPILNGRQLHGALRAVMVPEHAAPADFYRHHPARDDGGYLDQLVATCRASLQRLPSASTIGPVAALAALRCGEAQTRTHAASTDGPQQLARWSRQQTPHGFEWWETAAGATASLGLHALFAAASYTNVTVAEAERIDAVYHPTICALATLLDSLIDHESDTLGTDHRYIAYYASPAVAADRISKLAAEAADQARTLRDGATHQIIVAGIACFYLSAPQATNAIARPAVDRIRADIGPIAAPILTVLRCRRARRVA